MATLITGGTGYIASETVKELVKRGEDVVVFDIFVNRSRLEGIEDKIQVVQGDVSIFSHVLNVVKDYKIDKIYHMGAMLSATSEANPWASMQVNVMGSYHVMEAARLFNVEKVLLTSSRATFGLGIDEEVDDWTIQRPLMFYGCGKLYAEGMGRWYDTKFGIDFRALRYPAMMDPGVATPGHWGPPMIVDALQGKSHESQYATPEARVPWIYRSDAVKSAIDLMDAPKEKLKTQCYNVASVPRSTSATELAEVLTGKNPEFKLTFKNGSDPRKRTVTKLFSDKYARQEWGWQPEFDSVEAIVNQFEQELKDAGKI